MTAEVPARDQTPRRLSPYLLCFGIVLAFQACFILFRLVPVLDGSLLGPDSYMHMIRAARLADTGAWFDPSIPRANAPFGDVLNWTRPFDVLLLTGAWILSPVLGFKIGLFWSGVMVSPLLQAAAVITFVWAVAPLFDRDLRMFSMIAFLVQPAIMIYALAGRADHHVLIFLAFVVALGLTMRLLMRPYSLGLGLATGAVLGLGTWFSVEFLLTLAIVFTAATLQWILKGHAEARKNLALALGLLVAMVVALAAERPPTEYVLAEYDRFSVVHVFVAVLALAFWWLVERTGGLVQHRRGRIMLAVAGAVVAGGALLAVYPQFFAGPLAEFDPRLVLLWQQKIASMRGLLPVSGGDTARFLFYLGPALVTVPYLVWRLMQSRAAPEWPAWLVVGIATAVFLPLALLHGRFAPFAAVVVAIPLTEIVGRFRHRLGGTGGRPGVILIRAFGTAGLLVGFFAAGLVLFAMLKLPNGTAQAHAEPPCRIKAIASQLGDPRGLGARDRIILAPLDDGPELLYRTGHSVVGTPYHRNSAGILDTFQIFGSDDVAMVRRLMDRRGVDLVLVCSRRDVQSFYRSATHTDGLYRRLAGGRQLTWLRPVPLRQGMATGYRLFEVVR